MSPWSGRAAELAARIAAFVRGALEGHPPEAFETLALDVHRWQAHHDPVVASLVEGSVQRWPQIPAVPVGLFKDLPVGTLREGEPHVAFRTSGTTGGGRGVHRLRSTALYDLGATLWARRCVPGLPDRFVALLNDPAHTPDASLSHMVGRLGTGSWHLHPGGLDVEGLDAALAEAAGPRFVAATAFALAEWLDHRPPPLPAGSVLMVTGGFKGRVHRLDGAELYTTARRQLQPGRLVTEYGMTELSSQLWGVPGLPYLPPPWLRALAVDPATGRPLPAGEVGQLRFVDLCNLDGTLAIDTLDAGRVRETGEVELHGRLAGAPARGCSLTVEEAWGR